MLENSVIYRKSKEKLDFLFGRYHIAKKFGRILAYRIAYQRVNKLNVLQFQTAPKRYGYMFRKFPATSQRAPLEHIASYLGMTQEPPWPIRRNA